VRPGDHTAAPRTVRFMRLHRSLVSAFSILAATPAFAEDAVVPAAPAPAFSHLGPDGQGNEVGGTVGVSIPTEGDGSLWRLHLVGQGVDPRSGFGGYASLGVGAISGEGDSETGFGGIEVGGLYHVAPSPEVDAVFRLGVVLPTASDDSAGYYFGTLLQDPSNLMTGIPDTTVVRVAVSPAYHQDKLYLRADLGVDVSVSDGDDEPLVHADLGIGVAPAPVGGTLELQTICVTSGGGGDSCLNLLAASAQFRAGPRGVAHVGIGVPILEDDFGDIITIEGGFKARF
jgi:hypothetical protein